MLKQIVCGILLFAGLLVGTARGQTLNDQLLAAATAGDKVSVEALIAKGANVNAKDSYGRTPLSSAVEEGRTDVVELLIAKGADVNAKAQYGDTPLFGAANKDVAELLIAKGADINAKDDFGFTPLFKATNKDVAELLIAKGADINAKDNSGFTPLFKATNKDVAELLIAKGADVNAKNTSYMGWTPLHNAASQNNKDLAELLIAKGVDVNATDDTGSTPLHWAAKGGYKNVAELLISKGADLNAKKKGGYGGETPLHEAAENFEEGMVALLVAKGADVNIKDGEGETPLQAMEHVDSKGRSCLPPSYIVDDDCVLTRKNIVAILQGQTSKGLNPQDALKVYVAQFKGQSDSEVVRASIINLALKLQPAPTIPSEAEAAAGRGAYIFKTANSVDDKLKAAKEYLSAIELAPWVANYYYNLCTVLEKTPYTQQALHACKLYIVAAPNAADAEEMRQRIAGLQYAADRNKTQMKQRTAYIKSRGIDDLYRFGGITGTVSGREIAMKLFVDWNAAPPKYQVYVGCLQGGDAYGRPHDLVSTDSWTGFCNPEVNMHLVISPEGEGFVAVNDSSGGSLRATLDDLFKAKQQTMAQAVMFSMLDRFYLPYLQGGLDLKRAGYLMYESDCNGTVLKKDPRALPDDFLSVEAARAGLFGFGDYIPEVDDDPVRPKTDLCTTQFASKTGYHFGEQE